MFFAGSQLFVCCRGGLVTESPDSLRTRIVPEATGKTVPGAYVLYGTCVKFGTIQRVCTCQFQSFRTAGQPCAHTSILHSIATTGNIMEVPHCLHVLGPCSAAAPKIEVLQDLLLYVLALLVPGTCWRTSCNYRRCFISSYRLAMHYRQ